MTTSQETERQGVAANRSVIRAIRILRALTAAPSPMTATEVAKTIGLPRATTFRLLVTLEEEGIVERQDTVYSLGWDLARIAQSIDPASGLVPRIQGIVDELADEVGETTTFSLRRGLFALDLVIQTSPRLLGITMSDMHGMQWPHHASATGKLLLAELTPDQVRMSTGEQPEALTAATITDHAELLRELATVREQGWAATVEELEDGIIAFGAPVRDSVGALVGALSVVGPRHRMDDPQTQSEVKASLLAAQARIEERINPPRPEG